MSDGTMTETGGQRRIAPLTKPFDLGVVLPGSKSIALRQIVMSMLADGPTALTGVPRCDDVDAMFDAAVRLGNTVRREGKTAWITPPIKPFRDDVELDLGMSGVSLRLLLANAALRPSLTRFTGHHQLHRRPNADLLDALRLLGCTVESNDGYLPITVRGPDVPRNCTALRTDVTSQYLSGLMLAAPRMPQGLTIELQGTRTSASYIEITRQQMAVRGLPGGDLDGHMLRFAPGVYRGGRMVIEGDASAATYHAALATLHAGSVRLCNLGSNTTQGDYGFLDVCQRAGAQVERRDDTTRINGPARLHGVGEVDFSDMPDAAPTLMAMAPFLPTPTHLTGLATLRVKECDRIAAGANELAKAGVKADERADAMTIYPAGALRQAAFETYEDHRMAMAFSVLASQVGGVVHGADCVAKTYADYWEDFNRIY